MRNFAKILEPGAPKPKERLEMMQKCKEEGFLTGICFIPVLPFLSDSEEELDEMIRTAKDYGADFCLVRALTLFGNKESDCKTKIQESVQIIFSAFKRLSKRT